MPYNATGVKLQLIGQDIAETMPYPHISFTEIANSHITVKDCKIYDNHRGGISNCADNTLIEGCEIYNNGMDSSIGAPLFPDSTRYAINCEDAVSRDVIIRNNHIYYGINGLLMGCYNAVIENNIFNNINGVGIYSNNTTVVKNNKFYNSNGIFIMGSVEEFVCYFENNIVINEFKVINIGTSNKKGNLYIINNYFKIRGFYINAPSETNLIKVVFNNNYVETRPHPALNNYADLMLIASECYNNHFKYQNVNATFYEHYIKGGNNTWENARLNIRSVDHPKVLFTNDTFINCIFVGFIGTTDTEYEFKFQSCTFINTTIGFRGNYVPRRDEVKSHMILFNCDITIDSSNLFTAQSYSTSPFNYYLYMKDCIINYINTVKPKLIFYASAPGRLFVNIENTRVNGNDNFENLIK